MKENIPHWETFCKGFFTRRCIVRHKVRRTNYVASFSTLSFAHLLDVEQIAQQAGPVALSAHSALVWALTFFVRRFVAVVAWPFVAWPFAA